MQLGGSTSELYRPIVGSTVEVQTGSWCVLALSWLAQQSFCSPCHQSNAKQPWGFVNVSYQGHLFSHPCFLLSPDFCTGSCAVISCVINFFPAFNSDCSAKFGSELKYVPRFRQLDPGLVVAHFSVKCVTAAKRLLLYIIMFLNFMVCFLCLL